MEHPDDPARSATVAVHSSKIIRKGTLRSISSRAEITIEEFRALL